LTRTAGHAFTARTETANARAARGRTTAIHADPLHACSSFRRKKSSTRLGAEGFPIDSACGVAGTRPATPPTDVIYLIFRICLIDCAATLVGSGWKSTWARYDVADPYLGLTAHSRTERTFLAVDEDCWFVDTMAYS